MKPFSILAMFTTMQLVHPAFGMDSEEGSNRESKRIKLETQQSHDEDNVLAETFLDQGDFNDRQREKFLFLFSTNEQFKTLFLKSKKNQDINVKNSNEQSLLHLAAQYDGTSLVAEWLLSRGAQIDAKDNDGITPLHLAAETGHLSVVEFLLSKGAQIDAKDNYGTTPLILATDNSHHNVIEFLLSKGAQIDVAQIEAKDNDEGITTLHWAASKGNLKIVAFLLNKGALLDAKDNYGSTPLDMARRVSDGENKQKIIDTLESLSAFQQRNTAALFTHIDQGRLVDLELFKRDLELTAFNQNDLNSFLSSLLEAVQRSQFQLETAKRRLELLQARRMTVLESDYAPLQQDLEKIEIKTKIVELVKQRLSLKNICLRTLMTGFAHFGKYHTDPLACRDGITQDNAFADQPTEETVYANLTDPNHPFAEVLQTFPVVDRLGAQTPKEFVEKAMRQEVFTYETI